MDGRIVLRYGMDNATVKQAPVNEIKFSFTRKVRDRSLFLVNGHQGGGTFIENCNRGESVGRENKECQLIIKQDGKNAILAILLTKIVSIGDVIHNKRPYEWEFIVLNVLVDGIGLFPEIIMTESDYDDLIVAELPEKAWGFPREVALQLLWLPKEQVEGTIDYLLNVDLNDE